MSIDEEDRMEAQRRWNRLLDDVDAEIAEMRTGEYQAERAAEAAARKRWTSVPSSRVRRGTRTCDMTDEQIFRADLEGR